jgi:hypothetical protein
VTILASGLWALIPCRVSEIPAQEDLANNEHTQLAKGVKRREKIGEKE